jgi:hypothetical protein
VLTTSCGNCGIALNEQTRGWAVDSLCHVCEANDWWSEYGDDEEKQPTERTGSLKDTLTIHLARLVKMKGTLKSENYVSKSAKRRARKKKMLSQRNGM